MDRLSVTPTPAYAFNVTPKTERSRGWSCNACHFTWFQEGDPVDGCPGCGNRWFPEADRPSETREQYHRRLLRRGPGAVTRERLQERWARKVLLDE